MKNYVVILCALFSGIVASESKEIKPADAENCANVVDPVGGIVTAFERSIQFDVITPDSAQNVLNLLEDNLGGSVNAQQVQGVLQFGDGSLPTRLGLPFTAKTVGEFFYGVPRLSVTDEVMSRFQIAYDNGISRKSSLKGSSKNPFPRISADVSDLKVPQDISNEIQVFLNLYQTNAVEAIRIASGSLVDGLESFDLRNTGRLSDPKYLLGRYLNEIIKSSIDRNPVHTSRKFVLENDGNISNANISNANISFGHDDLRHFTDLLEPGDNQILISDFRKKYGDHVPHVSQAEAHLKALPANQRNTTLVPSYLLEIRGNTVVKRFVFTYIAKGRLVVSEHFLIKSSSKHSPDDIRYLVVKP